MTANAIAQAAIYVAILAALTKPLGAYMARVYSGERTFADPVLRPIERVLYRMSGVDPAREMRWTTYVIAVLASNLVGLLLLFLLMRVQGWLPLNPTGAGSVAPDLAFNTATSFVTNTNWQAYAGETTMSHLTQMAGLTVQNFLSAATGMAVAVALVRGLSRHSARTIGNFWVDFVRSLLWVLLPLAIVVGLVLASQGVIQNLDGPRQVTTVTGTVQTLAQGPVASQEAIKLLGTNGGGFFNANSAHPYENPTPLTNLVEMLAILVIPAGMTYMFGRMVRDTRQGWAIFGAMMVLFLLVSFAAIGLEARENPLIPESVNQIASNNALGGFMEGKEVRFGITGSALFAVVTTAASCGAVNAMLSSFSPLGGLVPLNNMALGEVIFGGVGTGLYGMLIFAILAVFITGLLVGRTPEYLGKKIEPREMKFVVLTILVSPVVILLITALSSITELGLAGRLHDGAHGFSEILYAGVSTTANNGSAFAGLSANSYWYNSLLGIAMLAGRFLMIVPILAVAGSMASKKRVAATAGTFPTHSPLFVTLLIGVILIVAALSFFPAYSLGPIAEDLMLTSGKAGS